MMFSVSVVSQSYIPAVSSVQNDLVRVQRIYKRTVSFFLAFLLPVSIISALFSHDIIRLMYDPRYQLSYISLLWFALAGSFRIIGNISGATLFALGKPVFETLSMAMGLVLVAILIFLGGRYFQLSGVSCAMAVATSMIPVMECVFLVKGIGFSRSAVLRAWGQAFFTIGTCVGLFLLLRAWLSTNRFYNLPFMILMGLISLAVSFSVHRYLEGANPFRDYSEASAGGEQTPRVITPNTG
jgi:O-antigen/teichoic acid export membrane protein